MRHRQTITTALALAALATIATFATLAHAEPGNETLATAKPISFAGFIDPTHSVNISSDLSFAGDVDYFAFQVTSPGTIAVGFSFGSSFTLPNPRFDLLNASGSGQVSGDQFTPGSLIALQAGTYYTRISSTTSAMGSYNFSISTPRSAIDGATIGPFVAATTIPEPGTLALMGMGIVGMVGGAMVRKRRGIPTVLG